MRLQKIRRNKGAGIVEFALVFPLLMIVVFSIIDFGFFFFIQHTIQFATREAVRFVAVGRTLTNEAGFSLGREASLVKTVRNKARIAVNPALVQVSVFPVDPGQPDPVDWEFTQDAGAPGSYMRVRTRYTYRFLTPFLRTVFPDGRCVIQAQATYRNEMF